MTLDVVPLDEARRRFARWYLREMVDRSPSITEAARAAGLNRAHFYELLERYGVAYPRRAHVGNWRGLT